ncbi:MAG: class I SAM-dependent methyltransferase [Candidatus Rokubacteria bacterium]|nr:class I SAM-dependent methyltransferase [Candidatus Rokubacteria bacterium]
MSDQASQPGAVDVARLMEEIKERVRQRRAAGFYSEEEVRRIAQMELEVTEVVPGFQTEIEHHLALLNDAWDTAAEPVITSHRKGVGRVIVALKRLLRGLTRPYITLVLARQVGFNSTLLRLLNAFVLPVRDQLREGLVSLQRKTEELSLATHERLTLDHAQSLGRHRELAQRVETLAGELIALRAALDRARTPAPPAGLPPAPTVPPGAGRLPPTAYLRFEDRHRGTREEIRHRQRGYLDLFPAGPVLDVGCGRGEFLELCRESGIEARGVDLDPGMVAACREAGLAVEQADALDHLAGLPDGALGGVFCAQVIEHVPPEAFVALVRLALAKLRPGGVLLCETPNPACLTVFSGAFYVDLTHIRPIHPEAARFVLEAAGFRDVEVRYVNPCPPESKLQPLEPFWYMRRYEEAFLQPLNDNFARLNELLWGAQDYAVIGRKA